MMRARASSPWAPLRGASAALAVLVFALSCGGLEDRSPQTGGETNFLSRCEADGSCGEGLSCLCGTCTKTCAETPACETLSTTAACVPVASRRMDPACPETAVRAFCDAECSDDAACAELGAEYRCDRGYCRALSDGCQTGETPGGEVVVLGDSFLASGEITLSLEELARQAGALSPGENYRDHSTLIMNNLALEPPGMSAQYAAAREEGAVSVVIMDGGGGDVLMAPCPEPVASDCPILQNALSGADALLQTMADDGVEHVVFFSYPDYVGNERVRATIDVLRPLLAQRCASAPLACHFLDLRPTFAGNYDDYILPDGQNPTPAGARAAAEAIWSLMQQRCIAQ